MNIWKNVLCNFLWYITSGQLSSVLSNFNINIESLLEIRKYKTLFSIYTQQIIKIYKHMPFGDDVSRASSTFANMECGFTSLKCLINP